MRLQRRSDVEVSVALMRREAEAGQASMASGLVQ